ncbi:hypothetical protein DE146DRAFT_278719 [Phaeosphaeria sp. MPI-PUGE-AT-0046c]|nr:hypothetical protein DE146DRAFT_278719 [Phaeosphaeria sp. MPI-PUGE-AT-0046c]
MSSKCVFSGTMGNQNFLDTFDHPSPGLEGTIVSIYNLGCFTGFIIPPNYISRTTRCEKVQDYLDFNVVQILPTSRY